MFLWLRVTTTWRTVLKGQSIRKGKNHCSSTSDLISVSCIHVTDSIIINEPANYLVEPTWILSSFISCCMYLTDLEKLELYLLITFLFYIQREKWKLFYCVFMMPTKHLVFCISISVAQRTSEGEIRCSDYVHGSDTQKCHSLSQCYASITSFELTVAHVTKTV